jgi:hypothetical protein
MTAPGYKARKRAGQVTPRPRKIRPTDAPVIRMKFFDREMTQTQLALVYDCHPSTINSVVNFRTHAK